MLSSLETAVVHEHEDGNKRLEAKQASSCRNTVFCGQCHTEQDVPAPD